MISGALFYIVGREMPLSPEVKGDILHFIEVLQPTLLFSMLFVAFCKVSPRDLKPRRLHLWLTTIQCVSFSLLCLLLWLYPAQGAKQKKTARSEEPHHRGVAAGPYLSYGNGLFCRNTETGRQCRRHHIIHNTHLSARGSHSATPAAACHVETRDGIRAHVPTNNKKGVPHSPCPAVLRMEHRAAVAQGTQTHNQHTQPCILYVGGGFGARYQRDGTRLVS